MRKMEKMVEIANFQRAIDAEILVSLLKSAGIACYVRNEVSNRILAGVDIGARVELLENDVPRALEIMKANGYLLPDGEEWTENTGSHTGLARYIPFLRNFSLEKQIVILIVLTGGLLALFIYIGSCLSSAKF
jgi:hypothetical protein